MSRRMVVAASVLAMSAGLQAVAQSPPQEVPPKQLTGPNIEAVKEGLQTIHEAGTCTVTFIVSKKAEIKNKKADCSIPEMAPFVLKAMETVTYSPLTFQGDTFDSEPIKLPFSWPATQSQSGAAPVVIKPMDPRVGRNARDRVKKDGDCKAVFTIGSDGVPKDIQMTCTPKDYERLMIPAVAEMRYKPAERGGKPIDLPNQEVTLKLHQ